MKRIILLILFFGLFFYLGCAVTNNQAIAVPSYFYPGPYWDNLNSGFPKVRIAIINPNSGPANDSNYATTVLSSQAAGLKILGYVATTYSNKPILDVKGEIDEYLSYYPTLDGIFLDEVPTDCAQVFYYLDLYSYIRFTKNMKIVIINPGTQTQECYASTADIIMSFEGSYTTYTTSYNDVTWVYNYPASLFWHVVYGVSDLTQLNTFIDLSKQRNAAWIYATNDTLLPDYNPYDVKDFF
jgi:hypothetical protein